MARGAVLKSVPPALRDSDAVGQLRERRAAGLLTPREVEVLQVLARTGWC
jgi:hypothetical protein